MNKSEKEETADLRAELSTQGVVKSNKDIAERLVKEGVEVSYSTLTYIIDQYDRTVRDLVCEGYIVKTNNVEYVPELSGDWSMDFSEFDSEKHRCSVKCSPSQEMQQSISFVGVKVLGFKNASSFISQVTDTASGKINSVISRNGNIIIEISGIESISNNELTNSCIFLVREDKYMIDISKNILVSTQNKIVLRVPSSIEIGKYHLLIHTFHSKKNNQEKMYCQCLEFDKSLWVK